MTKRNKAEDKAPKAPKAPQTDKAPAPAPPWIASVMGALAPLLLVPMRGPGGTRSHAGLSDKGRRTVLAAMVAATPNGHPLRSPEGWQDPAIVASILADLEMASATLPRVECHKRNTAALFRDPVAGAVCLAASVESGKGGDCVPSVKVILQTAFAKMTAPA